MANTRKAMTIALEKSQPAPLAATSSGLEPIPDLLKGKVESAEGFVIVRYRRQYECAICGWVPPSEWGCVIEMENHLNKAHHIYPPKPFWISGYSDADIRQMLRDRFADKQQPAK